MILTRLSWRLLVVSMVITVSASTDIQEPKCEETLKADVLFMLDASNSINNVGWGRELAFVANFSKSFQLGPLGVQIGVTIFSSVVKNIFDLNTYTNHTEFSQAVLGIEQLKQLTYTYLALSTVYDEELLTSPAHGGRPGVPKFLFVITDGQSENITKTVIAAKVLRDHGIAIIAIGVGVTKRIELIGIAGDERNVYSVKNFAGLEDFREQITKRVCEVPTTEPSVPPCPVSRPVDIIYVIDSSGSIGKDDYEKNAEFIANGMSQYTLGADNEQIGILTYGTHSYIRLILTSSLQEIYETLLNIPYQGSTTNTHTALLFAQKMLTTDGYGRRPGANKTIILVTDGLSTEPNETIRAADEVKAAGINIICVGVGPYADKRELTAVASRPEYVFSVTDYASLVGAAINVSSSACNAQLPPVKTCPNATKVDLIFVLDSSASIGEENFGYNFDFISTIIDKYYIGQDGAKIALFTFGRSVTRIFYLSGGRDYIEQKLKNVPYQNSTTNTHLALREVAEGGVLEPENGARPGVRKVCVLLTDGKSTYTDLTLEAANVLKGKNVTLVTVGVGEDTDDTELVQVASKPEYYFHAPDYRFLADFASLVSDVVCPQDDS